MGLIDWYTEEALKNAKKMFCIKTCRHLGRDYKIGEMYFYKPLLLYTNELLEYSVYSSVKKEFLGYIDVNTFNKNFLEYGIYMDELANIDLMFDLLFKILNIIWVGGYNGKKEPYVKNGVYRYYDKDCYIIKCGQNNLIQVTYYHIYDTDTNVVGVGTKEFIDNNFLTVFEYNKAMKEVDLLFENSFYEGTKLKK